jgi:hypothetical protein
MYLYASSDRLSNTRGYEEEGLRDGRAVYHTLKKIYSIIGVYEIVVVLPSFLRQSCKQGSLYCPSHVGGPCSLQALRLFCLLPDRCNLLLDLGHFVHVLPPVVRCERENERE